MPWTGTDIADEYVERWLEDRNQSEQRIQDEVVVLHLHWDGDYRLGWLLEVRCGEGGRSSDFLAVFKQHGGPGVTAVEWWNHPVDRASLTGEQRRWQCSDAYDWFTEWILERAERG